MDPFSDPQAVARYAEGAPRNVPGYHAMQRMTTLLLAERVPEDARVLVLGAGGGLELKVFAQARSGWTFDGIDPSAEMLKLGARPDRGCDGHLLQVRRLRRPLRG
jgi:tRNA (cmo5U34)-methyltransferase